VCVCVCVFCACVFLSCCRGLPSTRERATLLAHCHLYVLVVKTYSSKDIQSYIARTLPFVHVSVCVNRMYMYVHVYVCACICMCMCMCMCATPPPLFLHATSRSKKWSLGFMVMWSGSGDGVYGLGSDFRIRQRQGLGFMTSLRAISGYVFTTVCLYYCMSLLLRHIVVKT
jgi:hypothetical protein